MIVTRQPPEEPLELAAPDQVDDGTLRDLCQQVSRLHAAGHLSRQAQREQRARASTTGRCWSTSPRRRSARPQSSLDLDVAEFLVACCVLVGPERALREALAAGWGDAVARALPYLQRAALTPHLRDLARAHEVGLKELRERRPRRHGDSEARAGSTTPRSPTRRPPDGARDLRGVPPRQPARPHRLRDDCRRARQCRPGVGDRCVGPRPVHVHRLRDLRPGSSRDPPRAPPVHRAPVGDQVHQPDRAELGGPDRDEPSLPSTDGRSARGGAGGRRRRRRRPRRWCRPACSFLRSRSSAPRSTRANSRTRDRIAACSSASPSPPFIGVVIVLAVPKVRARVVPQIRAALSEPLGRGQDPAQARRAVRRQHPVGAALRRLPRRRMSRLRRQPQPRPS